MPKFKSSETGLFVSAEFAKKHPKTTYQLGSNSQKSKPKQSKPKNK